MTTKFKILLDGAERRLFVQEKCEEIEFKFDLDDFSQNRILKGLDKIDITLEYISDIENFNKSRKNWKPKLT